VLEKHVLELMKNGVTLPKWHALHVRLAQLEKQVAAYLVAGVSWTSEGQWVNTAALRLEADLKRVKEENESLQRAYVRPDDLRAQVETLSCGVERLRAALKVAEERHREACLNGSNAMQVACSAKVEHLRWALELVAG